MLVAILGLVLLPLGRVRAWPWSGLLWACRHWPLIFNGSYHVGGSLPLTRALPSGASPWIDRLAGESGVVPLVLDGVAVLVVLRRPAWKTTKGA